MFLKNRMDNRKFKQIDWKKKWIEWRREGFKMKKREGLIG